MQRRDVVLGALGGAAGVMLARPAMAAETPALSSAETPALSSAEGPPVPPSGTIGFKILRNGTPVGEQHLIFTQTGDELRVDINAAIVVRVMGVAVFHYSIAATEHWSGGAFVGVDSKGAFGGVPFEVHANAIPGGFSIQSTKAGNYDYTGPQQMLPLTYWNKAMMGAMILNIETGHHYPATVTSPGWSRLATAEGGTLLAQRFDMTGKLHQTVWYDQYGQWDGLQFTLKGDSDMFFEKFVS